MALLAAPLAPMEGGLIADGPKLHAEMVTHVAAAVTNTNDELRETDIENSWKLQIQNA